MWINLDELKNILKQTDYPLFRDKAPINQDYPYLVYAYAGSTFKKASDIIVGQIDNYQISLFTSGVEKDFDPIVKIFNDYKISFKPLMGIQGDENDDTISNFFTYVDVIKNG